MFYYCKLKEKQKKLTHWIQKTKKSPKKEGKRAVSKIRWSLKNKKTKREKHFVKKN
jgi:hypothetical protein